ncbi:MAG: GGDEF domain-containing protein [Pseudomonadota bacterium]|nr:GGDEF domain-containing protein [Pseudomonadota bacterium]MDE3037235.1 GGDEF domain-containing protein [Pseudomonadota bacterium]
MKSETVKELTSDPVEAPARKNRASDRLPMLGIPPEDMTPAVSLAVTALLEKLDDLSRDLSRTRESLSEIERLVDVDCVAPIPNRRAFMRRLSWAITMHERYGHPSTILYFDINDFKEINDRYGHAAGDLAIRHISHLLSTAMRESDFLARIGGDEFAVIMYYASEEAARKRGAKIAEKLHDTPFVYNGQRLSVTTAYGYYSIKSGEDAETALASADMSMYVDKRRMKAGAAGE